MKEYLPVHGFWGLNGTSIKLQVDSKSSTAEQQTSQIKKFNRRKPVLARWINCHGIISLYRIFDSLYVIPSPPAFLLESRERYIDLSL